MTDPLPFDDSDGDDLSDEPTADSPGFDDSDGDELIDLGQAAIPTDDVPFDDSDGGTLVNPGAVVPSVPPSTSSDTETSGGGETLADYVPQASATSNLLSSGRGTPGAGGTGSGQQAAGDSDDSFHRRADGIVEVRRSLARGAMGTVSLALHKSLGRWVALKRWTGTSKIPEEQLTEMFRKEAQTMASLRHPSISAVFDFGIDTEGPWFILEYVEGPAERVRPAWPPTAGMPTAPMTLENRIDEFGPMPVDDARQFVAALARAIHYAHGMGVIHRDIKPANILIEADGTPKVVDFGIASGLDEARGSVMFSPGFGAPEQQVDSATATEAADIYSLGAVLWYCLTGKNADAFDETDAPKQLVRILRQALQKDWNRRQKSADELADQLEPVAAGTGYGGSEGVCSACGHRHNLAVPENMERKFCAECGAAIRFPCLSCGVENGIWSKFCGGCRHDLQDDLDKRLAEIEREQAQICEMVENWDVYRAVADLEAMAAIDHPLLKDAAEWATESLPAVLESRDEGEQMREQALGRAEAFSASGQYEQSLTVLRELPQPLQNEAVKLTIAKHEKTLKTISELESTLRTHLDNKAYPEAKPVVLKLIDLRPNESPFAEILRKIRVWEQKTEEKKWKQARKLDTAEAYRRYLDLYPGGSHAGEAGVLLAPLSRAELLQYRGTVAAIRREYLSCRTPELLELDAKRARASVMLGSGLMGIVFGSVFGFVIGGGGEATLAATFIVGLLLGTLPGFGLNPFMLLGELTKKFGELFGGVMEAVNQEKEGAGCGCLIICGVLFLLFGAVMSFIEGFNTATALGGLGLGSLGGLITGGVSGAFRKQDIQTRTQQGPFPMLSAINSHERFCAKYRL